MQTQDLFSFHPYFFDPQKEVSLPIYHMQDRHLIQWYLVGLLLVTFIV